MKKERKNKGITLIALIITIIVMLILVGVTVNVALNGGLFDTAKKATEKTNEALAQEKDLVTYATLIAKTDELVEEYPLNVTIEGENIKLNDGNMISLYKEILQEYGVELETLTLSQAIKTMNVFYEIYNEEIKAHEEEIVRNEFWTEFSTISGTKINTMELSTEEHKVYVTMVFAYLLGSENSPTFTSNINNVKYNILPKPIDLFGTLKETFDAMYPGGHFPAEEITGTAETDLDMFASMDGLGKICIMTEEMANGKILFIDGDNNLLDTKEYVGHAIALITKEELGESLQGGADYAGTPLKNVMLINTQTGDLIYVDDDGQPNKPLS